LELNANYLRQAGKSPGRPLLMPWAGRFIAGGATGDDGPGRLDCPRCDRGEKKKGEKRKSQERAAKAQAYRTYIRPPASLHQDVTLVDSSAAGHGDDLLGACPNAMDVSLKKRN